MKAPSAQNTVASTLHSSERQGRTLVDLAIFLASIAGVLIVLFRDQLIPAHFSFDGERINAIAADAAAMLSDPSYMAVGLFYRAIGASDSPIYAGLVGYVALTLCVVSVRIFRDRSSYGMGRIAIYAATLLFGAVYLGFYSKDVLVLPITAIVLFVKPKSLMSEAMIVAAMISYGMLFRTYWIAVAVLYIGYRILRLDKRSLVSVFAIILCAAVAGSLVISFTQGVDPDHFRTMVNESREDGQFAQSAIQPFVSFMQPFAGAVNTGLTLFALVLPAPLLFSGGGVYYAVLTVVIAFIWLQFFRNRQKASWVSSENSASDVPARCGSLILAFLSIQAIFEPDYGSAMRHLTPLLPAFVAMGMSMVQENRGAR